MASGYIATYLIILALVGAMGYFGADLASGEGLDALPTLDDDPGLFDTIGYGFEFLGYMFAFQGLKVFGIPTAISALISIVLNGYLMYVLIRLVRGGG